MTKLIITLLLFISSLVTAQVAQTGRWEIKTDQEGEVYKVARADSLGLVIYSKIYSKLQGKNIASIELIRLDTALKEVWRGYIPVEQSVTISLTLVRNKSLYILARNPANPLDGFLVIDLDIKNGKYTSHHIRNAIPFVPTEFVSTNGAVMISGYFNYRPLVLHYSFALKKSKILPGFFNEPGEVNQMKSNDDGSVDIIVSGKNAVKKRSLWIRNYNSEGELIKTTVLEPSGKRNLIFGRSVKMPNNQQVVAGVYGRNSEYSRGIFVSTISTFGEYVTRYYNFADLQNFFHYLRANQEKRIKKRIERRRVKGKRLKFNYRFLVQELVPYGNQFIMLGEAFYPLYSYRATTNIDRSYVNSSWYDPSYRNYSPYRNDFIFNGFQYTHAIVIGFDKEGKIHWDNSFEISDVRSSQLEQFVKIAPVSDHVGLLYLFNNLIRTKIIKDSQVLEGKLADEVKMLDSTDYSQKGDTQMTKLDYWYGHHMFASGFQNIRQSNERGAPLKRRVFFINKISYR